MCIFNSFLLEFSSKLFYFFYLSVYFLSRKMVFKIRDFYLYREYITSSEVRSKQTAVISEEYENK